jgi:pimeloyl-ACP methyl ester carboxylesterase
MSHRCQEVRVDAPSSGVAGAQLAGTLCLPHGPAPQTVELLVPGFTYNRSYWDMSVDHGRFSYVRRALAAGYATMSVDRLGTGRSTRPPGSAVTLHSGAGALYDVVRALHAGIAGHPFSRLFYVGHSLGSFYGWQLAADFPEGGGIDGYVITGALHTGGKPSFSQQALADIIPAALDPAFAGLGLDSEYLTTVAGTRAGLFYYAPTSVPDVTAADEQLKDTGTAGELAAAQVPTTPADSPSRAIDKPTLIVMGDQDALFCGPPDGPDCTSANLKAAEAPFYPGAPRLRALAVAQAGHDVTLHANAPSVDRRIQRWIRRTVSASTR